MFFIDKNSGKPYYEQIVLSIKEAIVQHVLEPGEQLPSVRELASQLMMNPNTISKAYKLLETQNVIVTVKGKGTFVKEVEEGFRDERQIHHLKKQLENITIEAAYLNVSIEEMKQWLEEINTKMGRVTDGDEKVIQEDQSETNTR